MKTSLLAFLVIYSLNVKNKEIRGVVYDKTTMEELSGVKVILNQKDTIYTNFDGVFNFQNKDSLQRFDLEYPSYGKEGFMLLKVNNEELVNE